MRRNYHSSECGCDSCCNARNVRAHAYVAMSNQGPRYGESDERYQLRVDRTLTAIEKAERKKNQ